MTRSAMASATSAVPDGGWGWMIVVANAMSSIVTMSVVTSFGLIFLPQFQSIGLSATHITTITSLSSICNMSMGLITAPLLKMFGYRKIATVGGVLFVSGLLLTAFASTFVHFIVAYSVLAAAGNGLATSAFYLALNTYFRVRRSKAAGITMTLAGLGPILYPQFIVVALDWYGVTGCVLLLAAVSGHIFVAAAMLQPVRWHMRPMQPVNSNGGLAGKRRSSSSLCSEDADDYSENAPQDRQVAATTLLQHCDLQLSTNSLATRNVRFQMPAQVIVAADDDQEAELQINQQIAAKSPNQPSIRSGRSGSQCCSKISAWFVRQFDLDLLGDRRFVNIIVGMGIAAYAEINFSVLTPFILEELGYSKTQTGSMLSVLAGADIAARFAAPFVGDWTGLGARLMYMLALGALVVTRMSLLAVGSYAELILLAVAMGAAKGIRTVYMILVIPGHVAIEKLPAAAGLRMVANTCVLMVLGPFVGIIRDHTGDYVLCIVFMNGITCLSLVMWSCEMIYVEWARRRDRGIALRENNA